MTQSHRSLIIYSIGGFEVTLPLFEGDEAEVREDHKESLLICDAVVIFYGNSSEGWLRTKLRDLQKIPGYGRTKPMLAQAIYTGPPENPTKQRYQHARGVAAQKLWRLHS
jgi:hypothetical protein